VLEGDAGELPEDRGTRWVGNDAAITVRFVNGKVGIKSFDKPTGK